jgi:hypothetical protein
MSTNFEAPASGQDSTADDRAERMRLALEAASDALQAAGTLQVLVRSEGSDALAATIALAIRAAELCSLVLPALGGDDTRTTKEMRDAVAGPGWRRHVGRQQRGDE